MAREKFNESDLYIIQAVTNLHVGSGDNNFGIIDNQVQRDVLTGRPTINSSSLKGSLREYFDPENKSSQFIRYVFGSPPTEKNEVEDKNQKEKEDKSSKQEKGKFTFVSATLLSIPLRSNTKTFFRATSPEIIEEFISNLSSFDIKLEQEKLLQELANLKPNKEVFIFEDIKNETIIEDTKTQYIEKDLSSLEEILGKDIAIVENSLLNDYCADLPIVARNHLENGESQNLWYEEIVPRESRFYFTVTKPKNLDNKDSKNIGTYETKFDDMGMVQIGANATIGYGYTKINKVKKVVQDEN